jgi:hypothetical protein
VPYGKRPTGVRVPAYTKRIAHTAEIREAAEKGSPVTQNVLQGTPIQSEIKKV